MKVVAVAGYQNSGKTTLIERLVPALARRGPVATVKSIHHDVTVDTPGKDTYRHRQAGAAAVVGLTPSLTFSVVADGTEADRDPDASLERGLAALDTDRYDYVIAEGFKSVDVPTVLVGDIEREAVAGRVLTRVREPSDVDVGSLVDLVESVEDARFGL